MAMDWSIALVPLALLPIILIFGFVGCVLDRSGSAEDTGPSFIYPPDLNLKLVRITVTMKVGANGSSSFGSSVSETQGPLVAVDDHVHPQINPKGDVLNFLTLNHAFEFQYSGQIGTDFTADCDCRILVVGQASETAVPAPTHLNTYSDQFHYSFNDFQLVVTGSGLDPADYSVE